MWSAPVKSSVDGALELPVAFGRKHARGKAVWRFASHRTPNSSTV
jgi:hypothetical protein